eukprot:309490_1
MISFILLLILINDCISSNYQLAHSPLVSAPIGRWPYVQRFDASSAGATDERITPSSPDPQPIVINKNIIELFAIPATEFKNNKINKLTSQKLADRLIYFRKNDLLILPRIADDAIHPSAKKVVSYFSPIDVAADMMMYITLIMDPINIPSIKYPIRDPYQMRRTLAMIQKSVSIIGNSTIQKDVGRKVSDVYALEGKDYIQTLTAFVLSPSEFIERNNLTIHKRERIRWNVKKFTIDFWYFSFEKIFTLKMEQLILTLQNSTFISDEYGKELLHDNIDPLIQNVHELSHNLWIAAKVYHNLRRGGSELKLNVLTENIHLISRLFRKLEAFKIELDVANIIEKWNADLHQSGNNNVSKIAVDVTRCGHNGYLNSFLHFLGVSESNIRNYDVVGSVLKRYIMGRTENVSGLDMRYRNLY